MAETESYDVIIAGGGFVGMSLALALGGAAPKGFRVALVDAEPPEGTKADARASALSAASKGLLSVLGVWPELAEGRASHHHDRDHRQFARRAGDARISSASTTISSPASPAPI